MQSVISTPNPVLLPLVKRAHGHSPFPKHAKKPRSSAVVSAAHLANDTPAPPVSALAAVTATSAASPVIIDEDDDMGELLDSSSIAGDETNMVTISVLKSLRQLTLSLTPFYQEVDFEEELVTVSLSLSSFPTLSPQLFVH